MKPEQILISDYDYALPDERIARYPLPERDSSKLLVWRDGAISRSVFSRLSEELPERALLVFNDTKVIRARIMMRKQTGALIEIFCLEPHEPTDYERSLSSRGACSWNCIVGNSKKWKEGALNLDFDFRGCQYTITASRDRERPQVVNFHWNVDLAFGELLEILGRIPIPPYLGRESQEIDNTRYQTVYSRHDGSVAAPTAGLHFTDPMIERLGEAGADFARVTLHVGAGTFLPVKAANAVDHPMHTEHFTVTAAALRQLVCGRVVIAVGTTTVRTIESLTVLGYRCLTGGHPDPERAVGQWEAYPIPEHHTGAELIAALLDYMEEAGIESLHAATQIMIAPGYRFRITEGIVTNFHQPKSTLLLLVSAFTSGRWKPIYEYALGNDFRFLSYGDSSILLR